MFVFNPEDHSYTLDGKALPSVSQIIRGDSKMYCRQSDLDRGRAVHAAISFGADLDIDTLDERVKAYHTAFEAFKADTDFITVYGERPLASKVHGYAGTPDMVGHFNDPTRTVLIDIKTGKTLDKHSVKLQTAAYQVLLHENFPDLEIAKRFALLLKPDGKYALTECVGGWTEFNALLQAHHAKGEVNA